MTAVKDRPKSKPLSNSKDRAASGKPSPLPTTAYAKARVQPAAGVRSPRTPKIRAKAACAPVFGDMLAPPSQNRTKVKDQSVVGQPLDHAHCSADRHPDSGVVDPSAVTHCNTDSHTVHGDGNLSDQDQPNVRSPANAAAVDPGRYLVLRALSEAFWDAQKCRISIENRISPRQNRPVLIDDQTLADIMESSDRQEAMLKKAMIRAFKTSAPHLVTWADTQRGIGIPTLARLIGVIGSPAVAFPHHWEGDGKDNRVLVADEPFNRTLRQLWQYSGYGDAELKRRKGMSAEEAMRMGNQRAKMLLFLMVQGVVKATKPGGNEPYRVLFDETKARYIESGLTPGHAMSCAYRAVSKEILRDLWQADRAELGL